MDASALTRGLLFLSLAVTGVPGNIAVIFAFLSLAYQERLSPADAIVLHLAIVNLANLSVRCVLEVLASFSVYVFDDSSCKAVIFLYRTSRSLSIWLTFVLSAYQCLSVSPPGSRRASARALLGRSLCVVFLALWLINASMSAAPLLLAVAARNDSKLSANAINVEFCFLSFPSRLARDANGAAQVGRDVVPMALMAGASVLLLVFLRRRQATARRGSVAERRAALGVITLVSLYLLFYGVDNGLWVYTLSVPQTLGSSLISDLRIFFSSLYAAVSPVVIIVSNTRVSRRAGDALRRCQRHGHIDHRT